MWDGDDRARGRAPPPSRECEWAATEAWLLGGSERNAGSRSHHRAFQEPPRTNANAAGGDGVARNENAPPRPPGGLTDEQRARIAAKREEALRRRGKAVPRSAPSQSRPRTVVFTRLITPPRPLVTLPTAAAAANANATAPRRADAAPFARPAPTAGEASRARQALTQTQTRLPPPPPPSPPRQLCVPPPRPLPRQLRVPPPRPPATASPRDRPPSPPSPAMRDVDVFPAPPPVLFSPPQSSPTRKRRFASALAAAFDDGRGAPSASSSKTRPSWLLRPRDAAGNPRPATPTTPELRDALQLARAHDPATLTVSDRELSALPNFTRQFWETKVRSTHWSPYDRVRVVNAVP